MVAFDADVLTLVLNDGASAPIDPSTGNPVTHARERVDHLIESLAKAKTRIIIPTPALSEVLVEAGDGGLRYVEALQRALVFGVELFDARAAVELAIMTRQAHETGDKRQGRTEPYQKIKLDRQIVAICKVVGVRTLYSSDGNLGSFAKRVGINVIPLHELPLPPTPPQLTLGLDVERADDDFEEENDSLGG